MGRFVLDGSTRELTNIEPELRIIHDCADGIKVGEEEGGRRSEYWMEVAD